VPRVGIDTAGVPLFKVGKMLGQKDVKTTDRYSHLAPECLQDAVNTGSLRDFETVTKTVTSEISHETSGG
jgi:hypothetical protein